MGLRLPWRLLPLVSLLFSAGSEVPFTRAWILGKILPVEVVGGPELVSPWVWASAGAAGGGTCLLGGEAIGLPLLSGADVLTGGSCGPDVVGAGKAILSCDGS